MILADFVTNVGLAIGASVGSRIYPVVAPLNATFPLMVYYRDNVTYDHTKDVADIGEARIMCEIMVKDSVSTDSAYAVCKGIADNFFDYFDKFFDQYGGEYRVIDVQDEYDDSLDVFKTIIELRHYSVNA